MIDKKTKHTMNSFLSATSEGFKKENTYTAYSCDKFDRLVVIVHT